MNHSMLVFGKRGQLASALYRELNGSATFLDRHEAPFQDSSIVLAQLDRLRPKTIIIAAAYTAVDRAESETEICRVINATTPAEIGQWAARSGATVIHFSTDYVFAGDGNRPYMENDRTAPLNVYGTSKRDGEKGLLESGAKVFVFRTSWLYSEEGHNFVRTMIKLGRIHETLRIVDDQVGAPTYTPHIASAIIRILPQLERAPSGIYHLTSLGEVSWFGFAEKIFESLRARSAMGLKVKTLEPVRSTDYPTAARRPLNSRLNVAKFEKQFGFRPPKWEDGLAACLDRIERRDI